MARRSGLGDFELVGDEEIAGTVLDGVAVYLGRKVGSNILQPLHDLQAPRAGNRLQCLFEIEGFLHFRVHNDIAKSL